MVGETIVGDSGVPLMIDRYQLILGDLGGERRRWTQGLSSKRSFDCDE